MTEGKVSSIVKQDTVKDFNVLSIGMVTDGIFGGAEFVKDCVEYLVEAEIIEFTDVYRNGYVELLTDVEGNDLMRIVVTLSDENGDYAKTNLDFKPFPTAKKAPFKVVQGKNDK